MEKGIKAFKTAAACAGGIASYMLGGFDRLLMLLLAFMALDYVSGLVKAVYCGSVNSKTGFYGILKKIMIIIAIILVSAVQKLAENAVPVRELTIMFYLTNEGISVIENLGAVVPIPKKLKEIFEQLKGDE